MTTFRKQIASIQATSTWELAQAAALKKVTDLIALQHTTPGIKINTERLLTADYNTAARLYK